MGKIKVSDKRRLANEARRKPYAALSTYMASYKKCGSYRGLEFSLTKEDFQSLVLSDCFFCGSTPKNKRFTRIHKKRGEQIQDLERYLLVNGLDRLDNNLGYTKNNSVPCCSTCNYAKRQLTYEEFISWIKLVYEKNLLKFPNETTDKVIKESKSKENTKRFNKIEDLFKDLES